MPLPFILGAAAAVASVGGVGSAIHGAVKMKGANNTIKSAEERHQRNINRFEETNEIANKAMDKLVFHLLINSTFWQAVYRQ